MSYPIDTQDSTQHTQAQAPTQELDMRISNDEKEGLVSFSESTSGLEKFDLVMAFFVVLLIMSVFVPKIFISNNIYYTSREIARLHAEKELLHEERMRLQREIELINNKHLMLELGVQ